MAGEMHQLELMPAAIVQGKKGRESDENGQHNAAGDVVRAVLLPRGVVLQAPTGDHEAKREAFDGPGGEAAAFSIDLSHDELCAIGGQAARAIRDLVAEQLAQHPRVYARAGADA